MTTSSAKLEMIGLVKALNHPLRCRIVVLFNEQSRAMSPIQVPALLEEELSDVSYHVRVLQKHEGLRLINTEPTRGSIQHFYVRGSLLLRNMEIVERLVAE